MRANDVIRAAIPGATDAECHHIIWARTPFPFTALSARDFYKAASRVRRAAANGRQLCDLCDRLVDSEWLCNVCRDALAKAAA